MKTIIIKALLVVVGLAAITLVLGYLAPVVAPFGILGTVIMGTLAVFGGTFVVYMFGKVPLPLAFAVGILLALGLVGLASGIGG